MPKLPRIKGKDCCKALSRLGFSEVRQRGSHVVMRRVNNWKCGLEPDADSIIVAAVLIASR